MAINRLTGNPDVQVRTLGLRTRDEARLAAGDAGSFAKIAAAVIDSAGARSRAPSDPISSKSATDEMRSLAVPATQVIPQGVLTGVPGNFMPRAENTAAPVAPILGNAAEGYTQDISLAARFGALDAESEPLTGESFLQYAQRLGFPVGQYGAAATMVAGSAEPGQWYEVLQSFYG